MKVLSAIATALIFCAGAFFKLNRAAHIMNQTAGDSAYQQTSGDFFAGNQATHHEPVSSGVQANPFVD